MIKREKKLIEKIKNEKIIEIIKLIIILLIGGIIFFNYLNFITYKDELKGEKILYVKIDGKQGKVIKINNKYTKKQLFIKNNKRLEYGNYLIKFNIKKAIEKDGNVTLEGKIIGYNSGKLNKIRKYILNIFDDLFITNENLYSFSKAAILGEKSEMSKDMKDKFKYTGLAHLIVISGTHISLIVLGIVEGLNKLNIMYKLKYIISLIMLTFYCMLVGMSPGIMRAYIMGAVMLLARIFFEQEEGKKSLIIAFLITFILNPYSIFDISMQLSYAAVIAIIFVHPPVDKILEKKYFYKLNNGVIKETLKLLFLSFIIQLVSLPLFLYHFKKLPLFSFFLNVIGIPMGTILIQLLFFLVLLNIFKLSLLNNIGIFIIEIIFGSFEGIVNLGSKIPLLQIEFNYNIGLLFVLIYYLIITIVILYCNQCYKQIEKK